MKDDLNQCFASAQSDVYDAAEFIEDPQRMKVTPFIAPNKFGRQLAVPDEIAATDGYALSQRNRKLIEQG